jgi:hypothetical protein
MVSTVGKKKRSENPYHRCRLLPFPFDAEQNIMNVLGANNDCKIVGFDVLAL